MASVFCSVPLRPLIVLCALVVPATALGQGGDVVDFKAEYSLDGEEFFEEVDLAPGQRVFVRVTISLLAPGPAGIMDIMGDDDLDFGRIGGGIELFGPRGGEGEDGNCFVIFDEEAEILKVRCPFCDITPDTPAVLEFLAPIREDAPPGPMRPMIVSLLQLDAEGDPRPCTTFQPEPIGVIQEEELENPGITILSTLVEVEKRVSVDGSTFLPSVGAQPGQEVFFRVRIRNAGESPFFRAKLEDELPEGFSDPVLLSPVPASCQTTGRRVVCDELPGIAPGDFTDILYKATVLAEDGELVNEAMGTGSPGTTGNPGTDVFASGSAIVRVGFVQEIPALDARGFLLLAALVGLAIVLHRRRA